MMIWCMLEDFFCLKIWWYDACWSDDACWYDDMNMLFGDNTFKMIVGGFFCDMMHGDMILIWCMFMYAYAYDVFVYEIL